MRMISFDIGLRHLACCEIDWTDPETFTIGHWSVDSCIPDDVNVNSTSLECLVPPFTEFVKGLLEVLPKPDFFVIESQPMGHGRSFGGTSMGGSPRNLKTKVLSHILQSLLLLKFNVPIHFISPVLKMKECTIPFRERTYRDNKKYAIEKTLAILDSHCEQAKPRFLENSAKKDDLADSFLQGYTVCKCIHAGSLILTSPEFQKKIVKTKSKAKADKKSYAPKSEKKKTKTVKITEKTGDTDKKIDSVKELDSVVAAPPAKRARTKKTAKHIASEIADLDDA